LSPVDGLSETAVTCTNLGSEPLYLTVLIEGTPNQVTRSQSHGLTADVTVDRASTDKAGTLFLKQYDLAYVMIGINRTDSAADERVAVVQALPPGFEVVDQSYRAGWADHIGNRSALPEPSAIDYTEAPGDRWIGLPQSASGPYFLAFSVRPTLQGTFVLPPLAVYDLHNPLRRAWTEPRTIVVNPSD
jgi:uncharacterized protein YfaS (alpha-2-macroglobulin family)